MTNIYSQAVAVVADYLGPAADRFLRRQIDFHLEKKPEQITAEDIPRISEWVQTSLSLLTEDKESIDECKRRLLQIV